MALLLLSIEIPDQVSKVKGDVIETIFHKLDLIGFVLFAPAGIELLLAIEYGANQYSWSDVRVIGLFCGAGATFIVFLY